MSRKLTLPQLKKYDISQKVIEALADSESRAILYISFIIISGIGVVVFYKLSKKLNGNKKYFTLVGYAGLMVIVFIAMPDNPDEITAPMNLVNEFRFVSVLGVSSFWGSVGIILGLFWKKFDKTSNLEYS